MCEVFQNMWDAAQLTDFVIQLLGMSVNLEHQFSNLKIKNMTLQPFEVSEAWGNDRGMDHIFKNVKFPLSHIHGVFRLVQTFVQYKEKQHLLKAIRNDKIMANQSLWAPHSALLCGLGWGRHWDKWRGAGQWENSTKDNQWRNGSRRGGIKAMMGSWPMLHMVASGQTGCPGLLTCCLVGTGRQI